MVLQEPLLDIANQIVTENIPSSHSNDSKDIAFSISPFCLQDDTPLILKDTTSAGVSQQPVYPLSGENIDTTDSAVEEFSKIVHTTERSGCEKQFALMDNKENECNNTSNSINSKQFEYEISEYVNPTKLYITRKRKENYQISPVYSNESDVDLSDTDPIYKGEQDDKMEKIQIFSRSNSSSTSNDTSSSSSSDTSRSSSSTSSGENTPSTSKNTKKRTRNPEKWKQNLTKRLRNTGQSYVSMSKSKKIFAARSVKPPCPGKCRLKCKDNINENERASIFEKFWNLSDINKQRLFVQFCLRNVSPRYKYTNAERPREENKAFYFTTDNDRVRVCKVFFKNTLDITDRMIRTTIAKIDLNGFVSDDLRGTHTSHTEIDPELLADIKNHINSIPRIESHYLRANTTRIDEEDDDILHTEDEDSDV
ncbi:unnamed protein product [Ceutorhynchus assimilis]|uniref:Uncharacterized protein n=1 Tax=Ceutorhynchus assimilis TaxID=467358 RepID=A0A9N9QQG0_9CUCU|nr:unnamed protein product [Ceutorhynchus assimilis]